MHKTADAVVVTKDLTDAETDLATTLVSGLSYFSSAAAETDLATDVADAETTAAYGLSSYCSAVADSAQIAATMVVDVETAVVAAATTVATRMQKAGG